MAKNRAAQQLGKRGGLANSPAQLAHRKTLHQRSPHSGRPRTHVWVAIAQFSGKDAGHVCYGRSREDARQKAGTMTTMSVVIRRETMTAEDVAALVAVGKL